MPIDPPLVTVTVPGVRVMMFLVATPTTIGRLTTEVGGSALRQRP